jgi:D-glycero-alpha-D-manno-heptose-7-phosphate kinase
MLTRQTSAITNSQDKFDMARENKNRAFEAAILLKNGDLDGFGYMLGDSWVTKKAIVSSMTHPDIDMIYNRAIRAGAEGGKLLGAGGGGFFVFYVHPSRRHEVKEAILQDPLCQVYDCKIWPHGSTLLIKD